jgi:hypothetical protein
LLSEEDLAALGGPLCVVQETIPSLCVFIYLLMLTLAGAATLRMDRRPCQGYQLLECRLPAVLHAVWSSAKAATTDSCVDAWQVHAVHGDCPTAQLVDGGQYENLPCTRHLKVRIFFGQNTINNKHN